MEKERPEHPVEARQPTTLNKFLWRYFTGHHLDGKRRTNATWFKRGTMPIHHVTWWSAKPRIHRMLWRWGIIIIPIGWGLAVRFTPVVKGNLAVLLTLVFLPYLIHHVTMRFVNLIPTTRLVTVHENIPVADVDDELDRVATVAVTDQTLAKVFDLNATRDLEATDDDISSGA
jgi:hypothetical protein